MLAGQGVQRRPGRGHERVAGRQVVREQGQQLLAAWHGRVWHAVAWYAVCSVGYGLVMAALPRLVDLVIPAAHSGGPNGANTVARVLGLVRTCELGKRGQRERAARQGGLTRKWVS